MFHYQIVFGWMQGIFIVAQGLNHGLSWLSSLNNGFNHLYFINRGNGFGYLIHFNATRFTNLGL
jgi:hypothetical protein